MQRFVVIGLGHFGSHAARTLFRAGKGVIAIDLDGEKVQDLAEHATQAVVADATDRLCNLQIKQAGSASV